MFQTWSITKDLISGYKVRIALLRDLAPDFDDPKAWSKAAQKMACNKEAMTPSWKQIGVRYSYAISKAHPSSNSSFQKVWISEQNLGLEALESTSSHRSRPHM